VVSSEERRIKLRVNPGFDPGPQFWDALSKDAHSAPQAAGVSVFQLLDDGEIVLGYDVGVRFWDWMRRRHGFSNQPGPGFSGTPAILFEPFR
jgi:hypothetical protein